MSDADDSDATQSAEDLETEDEGVGEERAGRRAQQQQNRSRATSPSASAPSGSGAAGGDEGFVRLTARQRARMEKEAGLAEDVAWHEMELLPKLTYSWKGRDKKDSAQLTEQEWLKRQETLERRRMRSLREKREAEEAVKAKIRRAVTARFRGKLGVGGDSGLDGQGGGDQEGGSVRPGWVKMRYTAEGVSLAWHPAAHPLSLPVAVVAVPDWPLEPVDLLLQPSRPGEPWQAPPHSSSSVLKAGCALTLQPCSDQQQQQQQQGEVWLQCVDSQGWVVGCLRQQDLLEALEFAGHPQPHQQQLDWQQWRAVVRSIRRGSTDDQLAAALVRLLPAAAVTPGALCVL